MAVPIRAYGYRFAPKKDATPDEIMMVLKIVLQLISNNSSLAVGPRKEIDDMPVVVRRHFEKVPM